MLVPVPMRLGSSGSSEFSRTFVSVTSPECMDCEKAWKDAVKRLGRDVVKNVIRGTKCNSIPVVDPGEGPLPPPYF